MDRIDNLRNKVSQFNDDLTSGRLVKQIISNNEAYIVYMNAEEQLYEQGINSLGVKISDYKPYAALTIEIKRIKGQPTNRVTLRDKGDFHSSFYVDAGDSQFEIKAADEKTSDLIRKYGRQILGLTDDNIKELIWEYIYPDLLRKAKQELL